MHTYDCQVSKPIIHHHTSYSFSMYVKIPRCIGSHIMNYSSVCNNICESGVPRNDVDNPTGDLKWNTFHCIVSEEKIITLMTIKSKCMRL